jgi:hypothetical protein
VLGRCGEHLVGAAVAGAGVDDQEAAHDGLSYPKRWAERLMRPSDAPSIIATWKFAAPSI